MNDWLTGLHTGELSKNASSPLDRFQAMTTRQWISMESIKPVIAGTTRSLSMDLLPIVNQARTLGSSLRQRPFQPLCIVSSKQWIVCAPCQTYGKGIFDPHNEEKIGVCAATNARVNRPYKVQAFFPSTQTAARHQN